MKAQVKKLISVLAYPLLLTATVAGVWYVAAHFAGSEFLLPPPHSAIKRLLSMLASRELYRALFGTLSRSLIAYLSSAVVSLALAVISLHFPPLRKFLSPLVSVLRALPTMAIVLLLVIWAGATLAPIIVALMVIFPTLYSLFLEAFLNVDKSVIDMARIDGANHRTLTFKFYLPLAAPLVTRSTAAALSLTVKLMVAAEVLSMTLDSLGAMMQLSRAYYEISDLLALTTVTVIVSLVLELLAAKLLGLTHKSWS